MKIHNNTKGHKSYAPFNGLRIELNENDIKELCTTMWIELGGSDDCDCIVLEIVKECEDYLRRKNLHEEN